MEEKLPLPKDPKLAAILKAAFEAFGMYGFRRTSMEDIAKGAEMSRAAVYLQFKNKEDIFRTLVAWYYEQSYLDLKAALSQPGSVDDVLLAGFRAQSGEAFKALLNSPHGGELLDAKTTAAGEVVAAGDAKIIGLYAEWLDGLAAEHRVDLRPYGGSAEEVARLMMTALWGLKAGVPSYDDYAAGRDQFALMFARGLTA